MLDCIVIGAGPAGSAASTVLAQAKRSVLCLEAEEFPRFHIGESMLPAAVRIWKQLGLWEKLKPLGFPYKGGADFVTADNRDIAHFWFAEWLEEGLRDAIQVDRAKFDEAAVEHARSCGADIRYGCRVEEVKLLNPGVEVRWRDAKGKEVCERAHALLDCSGIKSFMGKRLGLRRGIESLTKLAVFAHYDDVKLPDGIREGIITVVTAADAWYWVIPLEIHGRHNRTSVGCVVDRSVRDRWRGEPADLLDHLIEASSHLRDRMTGANRVSPVRIEADYSNRCDTAHGESWSLVGDAAAFLDPIFSTGFCLSQRHAILCAEAIDAAIRKQGCVRSADFDGSSRSFFQAVDTYTRFVRGFYERPAWLDCFMSPPVNWFGVRRAVVRVLAGDVHRTSFWLAVFFLFVRIQGWVRLVPRVSRPRVTDGLANAEAR
ncbi:MAG: NAD(P)/FAD-dependent oxidoreductase [Planctomycetota bacterium]